MENNKFTNLKLQANRMAIAAAECKLIEDMNHYIKAGNLAKDLTVMSEILIASIRNDADCDNDDNYATAHYLLKHYDFLFWKNIKIEAKKTKNKKLIKAVDKAFYKHFYKTLNRL